MMKRFYVYITYLIFLTMVVTAISFSRYAHTITGQGQASVAKVVVEQVPVSAYHNGVELSDIASGLNAIDMLPGDVIVYNFNIVNFKGSDINQVAVKYYISVSYSPSDPKTLPIIEALTPGGSYPSAGEGWTYLGLSSQITHSYALTLTWGSSLIDSSYKSLAQNISVIINVEQVD